MKAKSIVLIAALFLAPLASAQVRAFMEFENIEGESLISGYENQIEVDSWSQGVANIGDGPVVLPFRFVYRLDKSTAPLMTAALGSTNAGTSELHVAVVGGAQPFEFLSIEFSDTRVVSVKNVSTENDAPAIEVTLDCSSFTLTYTEQTAQGGVGDIVVSTGSCTN